MAGRAPRGLAHGADVRAYTTGLLLGIDEPGNRLLVSVHDGEGSWLPAVPGTYQGVRVVHVLLDVMAGGRAVLVLGPAEAAPTPAQAEASPLPQTPPPAAPTTRTRTVTITPTWSGTWRSTRGAWDRWNVTTYGGRSDVYQGDGYGSGPLVGLATYGNQLVNLGAISIDSVVLRVFRNGSGAGTAALVVQGSPHGAQPAGAPSSSGDTATTAAVARGAWVQVALPSSVRGAMRTGAVRGLAAVGGAYSGWGGTATAGSMALTVTYTEPN